MSIKTKSVMRTRRCRNSCKRRSAIISFANRIAAVPLDIMTQVHANDVQKAALRENLKFQDTTLLLNFLIKPKHFADLT